ncbi:hypothetical protein SAMN05192558_103430 [Actinokineospora alba]|uniref:Uncharacterized protein n=1 Tax=Actinokineospora alba TaxID=504798 RepID=A0A1H0KCL2_9PSEU|nr:hypothetical protein [Actinokineospora alba]TDP67955.1 hypothetical protein C8E96_3513 [Actinokineospora alba]SDH89600.1 hypothetical protein SAMN05421871_102619 [Actinokineospora alba]SDO53657.1 hypothetical protein SAMN05192558_103430 [Actinokineospora alba]
MRTSLTITALALAGTLAGTGIAHADGTLTWTVANSVATGDQDNASVASVRTGYTAVVWEDDRDSTNPTDNLHSEIFLRLYRDGVSLYEKKLSAVGTGNWRHLQPDVALHEDGSAVVVWADDTDGNGYYQIAVRAVNTAGTVTGSATANGSSAGQQTYPTVAADPDGPGFAVAFEDKQSTTAPTVRVSGFASITSKTYEVQAHATGGTHQRPDIAMGAAQNAIVVWDEDGDANATFNVARKSFTSSGAVKLAQAVVNVNAGGQQRHPSVAANFNGDFVVGWETDHTGVPQVGVRSFSATGTAGSAADTLVPGADPQVGIDDQRAAVVNWSETTDVYAQGLNPDGSITGRLPRQRLNTTVTGRQDEPAVAVDPWGLITLAYTDDNDGNGFDQVYLGTGLINSTW